MVPVIETSEMVKAAVPVLVSVTVCGALVVLTSCVAKVRVVGESVTVGAIPVPVRLTVCGLPGALSVTLTVPVRVPAAVGAKDTVMEHCFPAASEVLQVLAIP